MDAPTPRHPPAQPAPTQPVHGWHLFVPKMVTVLRQGYGFAAFRADAVAGLTVAIVALPLAMALAIASGATPEKGLITAVVAGGLISLLGGSRFQVGGPTGAFVVVVFNVIQQHGYDGLVLATMMAGLGLVIAGLCRLGTWIKFIPEPVVTGFTAGIAVIIFSSQVKDLLGLQMASVPAAFLPKWQAYGEALGSTAWPTLLLSGGALAIILVLRRISPKLPGFLIAVTLGALAAWALALPVETIGTRFGGIPSTLPSLAMPDITLERLQELLPSAFTIWFLAGVESLLSAMVADGMTGRRHRSNCELVAQGVANVASALVGGLPATGAIARTATNIRAGARSPVAGLLHAVFLLIFMLVAAPLASYFPLACLAAVLVIVAWNMSEIGKIRHLLTHAPWGDKAVLIITFGLTVLVDLTVAIEVGVVLGAMLFMHRMAAVVQLQQGVSLIEEEVDDLAPAPAATDQRAALPPGVEVFQLRGPLFFGAAGQVLDVLDRIGQSPRVLILRLREVPLIDASGVGALKELLRRCRTRGTRVIVTGVQPQPREILARMGFGEDAEGLTFAENFAAALALVGPVPLSSRP